MNDQTLDPAIHIQQLGTAARDAARGLVSASTEAKNKALMEAARALREATPALLEANARDVASVEGKKDEAFIDRLKLDEARVEGMASALEQIAELPDPVGRVLAQFDRPNGLRIERVAVPIGVIGMIYESRPNVGADASALCLKSGNAVILRGGSESRHSTREIVACMQAGLKAAGLPENAVQTVQTTDRNAVAELLKADEHVDLVIPRGGRGLVELVRDQASVPTLLHLDGNCHSYVHEAADVAKAVDVVRNAKLRRTGICGATESVVVDRVIAPALILALADAMAGDCELRGDETAVQLDDRITPASEDDWNTEYLGPIASVKVVDGLDEAIEWVEGHSSHHTDAILTEDAEAARRFMTAIDSAIVMHNASTQFADGGEFGMGAEIGIATGKMHARGPVGLEQLTSFKYLVHGSGQTRE
ncbi:glutamate-5-semialdehyde dehydrogenase [Erythrobacter litoralis]|uniref:Gamma-glutamyl phosphate reductase n=1 Tax=Erythrobacter litoralis (strain HTCC2594) TaxID=314225 RepID=PROA_ERYLH|nr:glutamate-5-semialdehyde dehydrogenase [Erythrobacter litoralis]Q2N9V1.1 RecName: Full=Gamma-glutamyl phosphate reductase; Short=GPR; AltName: Full=Glutamate-5-semialdehyde dehydrogenase; AltName: Full=Glutamyl-gamma-semialdehyde dehydrogenase; Short=GSA dehydrogenase [Erythrobacter litoralis HTCC2594]ABC63540.1 gamma-glutamyl phosphate reductase (GPR) [Erythrobacter litoralis HTCC2594]